MENFTTQKVELVNNFQSNTTLSDTYYVNDVGFSDDNKMLITYGSSVRGAYSHTRYWNITTGKLINESLEDHSPDNAHEVISRINSKEMMLIGKPLEGDRKKRSVYLMDYATKKTIKEFIVPGAIDISSMSISADLRFLAGRSWEVPSQYHNIFLFDLDKNTKVRLERTLMHGAMSFTFSNNSKYLISTHSDGSIKFWNTDSSKMGSSRSSYTGNPKNSAVTCAAISADGSVLATAGRDQMINLWGMSFLSG